MIPLQLEPINLLLTRNNNFFREKDLVLFREKFHPILTAENRQLPSSPSFCLSCAETESLLLGLLSVCTFMAANDLQPWEQATEMTEQLQKVLFSSINERIGKLRFDYDGSA
jgi:hypothetical protein